MFNPLLHTTASKVRLCLLSRVELVLRYKCQDAIDVPLYWYVLFA